MSSFRKFANVVVDSAITKNEKMSEDWTGLRDSV